MGEKERKTSVSWDALSDIDQVDEMEDFTSVAQSSAL